MKWIFRIIAGYVVLAGLAATPMALIAADDVKAVEPKTAICQGVTGAGGNGCNTGGQTQLPNFIKSIVNTLLFVVGAVAVIVIVVGGLRYVLSGGDQNSVNSAKNTILYAVVGLIVAILAYAIVNFVVGVL